MENDNSSQSSVRPSRFFYEYEDPKLKAQQEKRLSPAVSAPLYTVWKDVGGSLDRAQSAARSTAKRHHLRAGTPAARPGRLDLEEPPGRAVRRRRPGAGRARS